ncbi:MAG: MFS transporter, partial [Solirubrobacterales bacterium]|nr:MFS transporter [Solirubrobacterales bacterium]
MGSYLLLLKVPHMAPLLAATLIARLPIGINGLAIVLFLRAETGSFAVAGAAAGALALGSGVGAPVGARLIDRLGPAVLPALAVVHAAGLVGLVTLGSGGASTPALVAVSAVTGMVLPPVSSVLRALYPRLLASDEALTQTAFALDSVLTEVLFVAGPLIIAGLVAFVNPGAALLVSGAAVVLGTVSFFVALPARPAREPGLHHSRTGPLGALRDPGMRTLVFSMVPVGFAFGAIEVAIPAFADAEGRPELAGILIAIWSLGSAVGGLVYGARPRRASLAKVHLTVAMIIPLSLLPVALAWSPAVMAFLVVPAGIFIAPLIATRNELAGTVAPPGAETEAYTWPLTALVSGIALGAAVAGVLVDSVGWRSAV